MMTAGSTNIAQDARNSSTASQRHLIERAREERDTQKVDKGSANPPSLLARDLNSIVYLTTGSADSLAALAGLADFTASFGGTLTVLHLASGERASERRLAVSLAALPAAQRPEVLTVTSDDIFSRLNHIAVTTGGILALLPRRPRLLGRFLLGSEYERMLHTGPLPILALPTGGQVTPPRRVLFPADLSPRSIAAFDQAVELCQVSGAELHLLHVFGDDRLLPSELDMPRRTAAKSPHDLLTIDRERLHELFDRATSHQVQTVIQTAEGRAHAKIVEYIAAHAIDLIVMPSHGPRSAEDVMVGSTTVRVIQRAPVAVLAMRA